MPRWRPPRQKSSPYITPEGEQSLRTELKELWLLRRKDVVPALMDVATENPNSGCRYRAEVTKTKHPFLFRFMGGSNSWVSLNGNSISASKLA